MREHYHLISAVQDLHDIYARLAPAGPYRLPLFHDRQEAPPELPPGLHEAMLRADALIRGITCLLANQLPAAALPVIAELWAGVQRLEQAWGQPEPPALAYYRFLSRDLSAVEPGTAERAYRLFGEVLAVYLDILAALELPGTAELPQAVRQLRARITQTEPTPSSGSSV